MIDELQCLVLLLSVKADEDLGDFINSVIIDIIESRGGYILTVDISPKIHYNLGDNRCIGDIYEII